MSIKPGAIGLMLLLGAAAPAMAQTSLSASLPSMGGTGISPHGTGFSGSMGDPDYYVAGSDIPASEGHYPGPYGTMGAPGAVPGTYRYAPPPPAMQYSPALQYNWTGPGAR